MAAQPGFGGTWSETLKTGFLTTRLISDLWTQCVAKDLSFIRMHMQDWADAQADTCKARIVGFVIRKLIFMTKSAQQNMPDLRTLARQVVMLLPATKLASHKLCIIQIYQCQQYKNLV